MKDEVKLGLVKNTGLEGGYFIVHHNVFIVHLHQTMEKLDMLFSFAADMKNDSNNNLFSLEKYYNDIWEINQKS